MAKISPAVGLFPLQEVEGLINVETVSTDSFMLWDHGFDFYASNVRRQRFWPNHLIGWMGIIDPTYKSLSQKALDNLTLPRELSLSGDGVILQRH